MPPAKLAVQTRTELRKTGYYPWEQARIPCNFSAANCEPKRDEQAKGLSHSRAHLSAEGPANNRKRGHPRGVTHYLED